MVDELIKKLDELVGTDDFEYEMYEIMGRIKAEGAGFEIVEDLLRIMEKHPLDDFGMPGAMVRFIEKFDPEYIPLLIQSIKRAPSMHTLWMLNRCINDSDNPDEYIDVLKEVAANESLDEAIRQSAQEFVDYQEE
ncbi:MAG: hypothetical protein K6E12_00455 [Saccharofermentans sp.]|nr:hypothetical protein [Saccharofermentans sp.]